MKKLLLTLIGATGMLFSAAPATLAQTEQEQQVKVAILYNIVRFIEWERHSESESHGDFHICAFSGDRLLAPLQALSGKPTHKRTLQIVQLESVPSDPEKCQILFLSTGNERQHDLKQLAQLGILTIGDSKQFLDRDGCILIRRYGNKLGFAINKTAMDWAKARPSSKILKLAQEVR